MESFKSIYDGLTFDDAVHSMVAILDTPIARRKNPAEISEDLDNYLCVAIDNLKNPENKSIVDGKLRSLVFTVLTHMYSDAGSPWKDPQDLHACCVIILKYFNDEIDKHPYTSFIKRIENDFQ